MEKDNVNQEFEQVNSRKTALPEQREEMLPGRLNEQSYLTGVDILRGDLDSTRRM